MASVIALILLVVAAYVVVLAGGIAFEITGMDREMARFQALSAFTGVGFTTSASEQVVEHYMRRRIAMTLIVAGWAGVASVIATLMGSFQVQGALQSIENLLLGLVSGITAIYLLRRHSDDILDRLRRYLGKRLGNRLVPQEDLFRADGGLGVARVEVPQACHVAGIPLRDLNLRADGLTVLIVERDHTSIHAGPDTTFQPGDHLVVFGRLDTIQGLFAPGAVAGGPSNKTNRGPAPS